MTNRLAPNASIIRLSDGDAYGARFEEDGTVSWCSERQAGLDPRGPVAWLDEQYPGLGFKLVRDDGEAYRTTLRASLFGTDEELAALRQRNLKAAESKPCPRCKNANWIMVGHSCGRKD